MKLAVLGGSFNPIHLGHLALADEVCTALGYDRLLFVPTYQPPHKATSQLLSAEHRLAMVRLACADDGRFVAEDCELVRKGTSYTYDTICALQEKYEGQLEGKIGLVLGEDLAAGFHHWYRAQELAARCQLVLARRPAARMASPYGNKSVGAYADPVPDGWSAGQEPLFAGAVFVTNPELGISSTAIRERAASGGAFRYLVPPRVFEYITDRRLYADAADRK